MTKNPLKNGKLGKMLFPGVLIGISDQNYIKGWGKELRFDLGSDFGFRIGLGYPRLGLRENIQDVEWD